MNGPSLKAPLNEGQLASIDLLKEALAEALDGNISSVGIIVCMKAGYATVMAGSQASDLFMGAASLQKKILDTVEGGNIAKPKKSNILQVRQ